MEIFVLCIVPDQLTQVDWQKDRLKIKSLYLKFETISKSKILDKQIDLFFKSVPENIKNIEIKIDNVTLEKVGYVPPHLESLKFIDNRSDIANYLIIDYSMVTTSKFILEGPIKAYKPPKRIGLPVLVNTMVAASKEELLYLEAVKMINSLIEK